MTIFYFTLIRSLRSTSTLITITLIPVIMILVKPLWYLEHNTGFNLYGMVILYGGFSLVRSIMSDRVTGTITRILAAPITSFQYLFQSFLAYLLLQALQILLIAGLGTFLYHWKFALSLKLFICYTIFAATAISFSLAWNSLFKSKIMSETVFTIIIALMALLGGVYFPIDMFPEFLKKIAMMIPNYWLSNALLSLQKSQGFSNYLLSIAVLILFAIAYLIFGSKKRLE